MWRSVVNFFRPGWLPLCLLLILNMVAPAFAKYARVETEEVPVQRLLTNLESKAKSPALSDKEKADLEFQIGRLQSMAYALKTETARVRKGQPGALEGQVQLPFYGVGPAAGRQFSVSETQDKGQQSLAQEHLKEAIRHMRKALSLDPENLAAKLGLAWCLDQRGEKAQALPLYRQVFRAGFESEGKQGGGLRGTSIAAETADYLSNLLDPEKDAAELSDIAAKRTQLGHVFRAMTPIVVPVAPHVETSNLMAPAQIRFDLDGTGLRNYISWPTAGQAAWLVYDGRHRGDIRSGLQLFGEKTFWIFWRDGYQALSALDDNGDGQLNGAELTGLCLWQDLNEDGLSQSGEVKPLSDYGIRSLSCLSTRGENGMLMSRGGVTFENGQTADSYDWLLFPR